MLKLSKKQAVAELARRSLSDFARIIMPGIDLTPFQRSYYQVLDAFARGDLQRLIVTIPPQHGKSLGSTILLPAYLLGKNPALKIAIASYNARLASRFNRRIQQLIDTPDYADIFPRTVLKSPGNRSKARIRTNEEFDLIGEDGGLLSVGREGTLTGNPVDIFILDDLYKDALEANSPLIRNNTWEWYNAVVKSRLHNNSQEIIVFTRWHEDDLIGRIAAQEKVHTLTSNDQFGLIPQGEWALLNFEAIKQGLPTLLDPRSPQTPLWPERQGIKLLHEKQRLDPVLFETMYQGHPMTREGLLYGARFATYDTLPQETLKRANYTDTADTGEDFLCSICYQTGTDGTIYITDIVYSQESMEVTEQMVADLMTRNDTRIARIESNNGGRGFARAVGRLAPNVKIEWFHQFRNKEARILSNSATVLKRIAMPAGWQIRWSKFYNDLTTYRHHYKANRWHDAADVLTGIIEIEMESAAPKNIKAFGFV